MQPIKSPTTLSSFLTDGTINKQKNDVVYRTPSGAPDFTVQYRLSSDEARAFVQRLGELTPAQQKAVLKQLHASSANPNPTDFTDVAIVSSQAAAVFEGAASKLGLDLDFQVNRKRSPLPLGG